MEVSWRQLASDLEAEVEQLKSMVARCRSESANVKGELEALGSLIEQEEERGEKLRAIVNKSVKPVEGDRKMEVFALETQLVTIKVGIAQARFERDSLQSEVRLLREKLGSRAPSMGDQTIVSLSREANFEDSAFVVGVGMRVGSVYQAGALEAEPGVLKFYPLYRTALMRKERMLEIQISPRDMCYIEENYEPDPAIIQLLSAVTLGQKGQEPYSLLGLRSSLEVLHSHLKSRLRIGYIPPGKPDALAKPAVAWPPLVEKEPKPAREKLEDKPDAIRKETSPALKFTRAMSNPSDILEPGVCAQLVRAIPARNRMGDWQLLYSTSLHGFSLQTFFALVGKCSPTLLAIRDSNDNVFGCYAASPWVSTGHRYYGTGETFLFSAHPHFAVYKWTHANSFFQLSSLDNLAVGGGGKAATHAFARNGYRAF
mmetsp:Transcript_41174/g.162514  ORF Transcript_41174/g.162514 Transcript_41174/m.162514 type:complete len:428 (-) Transcript_41174:540-1823(-)